MHVARGAPIPVKSAGLSLSIGHRVVSSRGMMARARLCRSAVPFAFLTLNVFAGLAVLSSGQFENVAHAADVAITDDARARFSAGVNLLKDPEGPRYEEAY